MVAHPTKRMQLKCNPSTTRPSLQHAIVHLVNELLATHRCRVQLEHEPTPSEPVPRLSRARSEPAETGPLPLWRARSAPESVEAKRRRTDDDVDGNWTTWDLREFTRQEQVFLAHAQVPIETDNGNAFTARQRRAALNHARRGVLALLRYHAVGSAERVADLIVGAVSAFGVGERVRERLEALVPERAASGDDAAETALYISGAPVGRAAARARGADDLGAPPQSSRRDPRHSVVMDAAGEHLALGASHVDLSSAVLSHVILTLFI
ncbi:hypothetical protein T492DRAFT_1088298, partial [Pavlovales sp. CCMP2436]